MAVYFNGRLFVTPTVESAIDDSGMLSRNIAGGSTLAIIGRSEGGAPQTPIWIRSAAHARQVLRSGEGLRAVELAMAPSAETQGPNKILFVRVNPATQSALALKSAADDTVISLVSTDSGLYTNSISVAIESGSTSGKRVTTRHGNRRYSRDNVARNAFSVVYSGAEATATVTITDEAVTLKAPGTATPGDVIDLNVYRTVQEVVDRINSVPGWLATLTPGSANTPALKGLDAVTAASAKTTALTVTANLQAIVDFINSASEGFVTATRADNAVAVPANLAETFLTGGSDGNVTNESWSDCLDALETEDSQFIAPLSPDPAIWAMADAHCLWMSTAGKHERRCFVGAAVGVDLDGAIDHAFNINSDRTCFAWPGVYVAGANSQLELLPPYMHAVMIGAAFAGLSPGATMTNKSLRIKGLEYEPRVTTDTDQLITAGVCTTAKTETGYKVVKAVSTWLNDSKYNRVEVSCGIATDYTARAVRDALQPFLGMKANPITRNLAISRTESTLKGLALPEPEGPGVLAGDAANPAYRNITAEIEGDVLRVSFECSPVIPLNYVLIAITITPYSSAS
ncbi:MAG: hypothetical protein EOM91_18730 [Sphingobacteriia bacterium]|nr:hypothetical protein [Sphingobacteriia bacterium]